MIWFVYDNGHFYGTVIAESAEDALKTAAEKFGNHFDSFYEVYPRRR